MIGLNLTTLKIVGAVGAFAVSLYFAYDYGVSSTTADWNAERAKLNKSTADLLTRMNTISREKDKVSEEALSEAWRRYKDAEDDVKTLGDEVSSLHKEAETLRDKFANRPWRVRVVNTTSSCDISNSGSTAGMGNGTFSYFELPKETRDGLRGIAGDAERCEAKLTYLQVWVKEFLKKIEKANKEANR